MNFLNDHGRTKAHAGWRLWRWIAVCCFYVLIAGCAADPTPRGSRFVVAVPTAQFYKKGPAQDFNFPNPTSAVQDAEQQSGPDFQLPKGTTVTLLKRAFGYSRVMTDEGVTGFIANDQLRPAPALARQGGEELRGTRDVRLPTKSAPPTRKLKNEELDLNDLPLPS